MGHDRELTEFFVTIPSGLDVLLTHTPPYGKGDRAPRDPDPLAGRLNPYEHIGSTTLQRAIHRAKPRLVVYGHVHADGGWRIETHDTRYANVSVLDEDYYLARTPSEPLLPEP
jgi:Icc-related predicted phosphoesterase